MFCSLGATRELSGRSLGALWELVAVAGMVNSSRPWGSDTCIYIQLPPGATFNDHNTWIFKDAAQVMYVLEIILSHVGKKLFTTKSQVWHDAYAKFTIELGWARQIHIDEVK